MQIIEFRRYNTLLSVGKDEEEDKEDDDEEVKDRCHYAVWEMRVRSRNVNTKISKQYLSSPI